MTEPMTTMMPRRSRTISTNRHGCYVWCCFYLLFQNSSGQSDLQFKREPSSLMYDPSVNRAVFRCSVAPANAEVNWLWNGKLVNNSLNYLKFKENRRKLIVAFPSGGKWFLEKQKENIFQCVVSLGGKALVSRPAKLIVSELSSFPPQEDVRLSVVVGNVAVIPCKPPPGVPRVITKFVFDNRNIDKTEGRYRLMSSGDLHVLDVSLSDSGVYQCVAHNPFVGEKVKANHKVILEVQNTTNVSSPVLSAFPEPTTSVVLGSNVTLECVAHGFPPPQITWTKKNGHLPYHRNYQDTGNLLLFGVLEQDRGTYTCSANNSAGFVRAETALEVEEVPQIVKGPQNGYVQEGGDVKLDCEARGSLPLSFTWIHNGRVVSEIRHTTSNESSLVLSNIVRKQAGIYQCFASNKLDTTYAVSEVKVLPKEGASSSSETSNAKEIKLEKFIPDHRGNGERNETKKNDAKQSTGVAVKLVPPSKPDVTQLSEKSVLVRWKVPKNSGLSILFFKVQYKPAGNPWITVDNEIGPNVWSYTVSKLKTGVPYKFRVAAVYSNNDNEVGQSSIYTLMKYRETERQTTTPVILSAEAKNNSTILLHWNFREVGSAPPAGYFIYYRAADNAGGYTKVVVLGAETRSFSVHHLAPATLYDFKIQSFSPAGTSNFSEIFRSSTIDPDRNPSSRAKGENSGMLTSKDVDVPRNGQNTYLVLGVISGVAVLLVIVFLIVWIITKKRRNTGVPGKLNSNGQHNENVTQNKVNITLNPLSELEEEEEATDCHRNVSTTKHNGGQDTCIEKI